MSLCITLCPCKCRAGIGAIHSVVFAGFSSEAVADRIVNCNSKIVLTADAGLRGGKSVPLKSIVDRAIEIAAQKGTIVSRVLVAHRAGDGAKEGVPGWVKGRDMSLDQAVESVFRNTKGTGGDVVYKAAAMDAEDPLFILYTSGA